MPTKKKDSLYVSRQEHEMVHVSKLWKAPQALIYYMITQMEYNLGKIVVPEKGKGKIKFVNGKALRVNLYKALSALGYKKAK